MYRSMYRIQAVYIKGFYEFHGGIGGFRVKTFPVPEKSRIHYLVAIAHVLHVAGQQIISP